MKNNGKMGSFPEELVPVLDAAREAAKEPLGDLTKLEKEYFDASESSRDASSEAIGQRNAVYARIQKVEKGIEEAISPVLERAGLAPVFRGKYVQAMKKDEKTGEEKPAVGEDGKPIMVLNVDEVSLPSTRILTALKYEAMQNAKSPSIVSK